jgi:hypothetical protein
MQIHYNRIMLPVIRPSLIEEIYRYKKTAGPGLVNAARMEIDSIQWAVKIPRDNPGRSSPGKGVYAGDYPLS